jgi:hypothetical protein
VTFTPRTCTYPYRVRGVNVNPESMAWRTR